MNRSPATTDRHARQSRHNLFLAGDAAHMDLLRGPHWTVLVFDGSDADLPPATPDLHIHHIVQLGAPSASSALVDADRLAHDAYDATTPTLS